MSARNWNGASGKPCSDSRVQEVNGFEFDTARKKEVHVSFTVKTVYGDVQAERRVKF